MLTSMLLLSNAEVNHFSQTSVQAGQFIGARSDFVPEGVCRHLRKLQDQVPPMPPHQAEDILRRELRINALSTVFEWIDLDKPLGSASIAQVHKAKLRRYEQPPSLLRKALHIPVHWWRSVSRVIPQTLFHLFKFGTQCRLL